MTATRRSGAEPAPATAGEALARARRHARAAGAEALAALHALLDAASLAAAGSPSERTRVLGTVTRGIEELRAWLEADGAGDALVHALADALEDEIRRWEVRSREDPDARAVVRAFLGLRELLWELGVRPPAGARAPGPSPEAPEPPEAERPRPAASRPRRVRRVSVEG